MTATFDIMLDVIEKAFSDSPGTKEANLITFLSNSDKMSALRQQISDTALLRSKEQKAYEVYLQRCRDVNDAMNAIAKQIREGN